MSSSAKSFEAARRSTRIRAQIPFRLASRDPAVPFSEHCHTLVVNTEGCGVRLGQPLEPGLPVLLDGRIQPLDSVARNSLLSISGKSIVRVFEWRRFLNTWSDDRPRRHLEARGYLGVNCQSET